MRILSITGLVLLGAILGVSLLLNSLFLSGYDVFTVRTEKVVSHEKKDSRVKAEMSIDDLKKKYNNLVARYNKSLELNKRGTQVLASCRDSVSTLKQEAKMRPRIEYKKEYITKEVCSNPEPEVLEEAPTFRSEHSGALVIEQKEYEDESQYAIVEPIPLSTYTQEHHSLVVKEKSSVSLEKEVNKEPACITKYKKKLAVRCLRKTKNPVEILTKKRMYRGQEKDVYYCQEEKSKRYMGAFTSGPSEAKTYCHLRK